MLRIRQSIVGFAAVEALLIVVILAVIGGVAYFVYHANKTASDNLSSSAKIAQSAPSFANKKKTAKTNNKASINTVQQYVDIKEWGIKLSFNGAGSVTYSVQTLATGEQAAALKLKPSVTSIEDCQDLQTAIIRSMATSAGADSHVVGGYAYRASGDPSPCNDPQGSKGTISAQRDAILAILGNNQYTVSTD